jgi:hypothetical protein
MFGTRQWDYITIGSNGFAQFGEIDFYEKQRIELPILLTYVKQKLAIPEKFKDLCHYKIMKFPYDEDSYSEIVLNYNSWIIDQWGDSEDETLLEKHEEFWEFANEAECIDLETEELTELIKETYLRSCREAEVIPMHIIRTKAM